AGAGSRRRTQRFDDPHPLSGPHGLRDLRGTVSPARRQSSGGSRLDAIRAWTGIGWPIGRMLKKSLFSPARPWRAETRLFPCRILPSKSTHVFHSENKLVAWGGRVRKATPPVLSSAEALLDRLFEHRSEEHTSELQSPYDLVCRLLLEKKKKKKKSHNTNENT